MDSTARIDHYDGSAAPAQHQRFADDAVHLAASIGSSVRTRSESPLRKPLLVRYGLGGIARRTLGICLLLVTVFLWTLSNFLASFIFSDQTYNKPFFLLYVNSFVFAASLIPTLIKYLLRNGIRGARNDLVQLWHEHNYGTTGAKTEEEDDRNNHSLGERLLVDDDINEALLQDGRALEKLNFRDTVKLSLEFAILWSVANYFASACLEYTSVASVTILTSTSSIWTLVFCAMFGVETFSIRKLVGVMASLVGVVLISTVDLTGGSSDDQGSFPEKSTAQLALGDSLALFSAVIYGLYVTVMKRRVQDEDRVDMRLFFGLVGVFTLVFLWPLFFILHWTNIEPFEMPPSSRIWTIIIINSLSSFVSDVSWAFAMLLTTPLVVTVGLSLTIPLSLIGEMIQYGRYSTFVYWIGAAVVFVSFAFVNHESPEEESGDESGAIADLRRDEPA